MKKIKPNSIVFNEDDVDHKWDEVQYDKALGLWYVGGLQGYTMDAWVKAKTAEQAVEKAEELYDENA